MSTLLTLFERQPSGFHFVDVGANMALYSAICGVMFRPGRVIAFEPAPSIAAIARRVLKANGIGPAVGWVERRALGQASGTATLYLGASDSSNSLVPGFTKSIGSIDVDLTTLDAYVEATTTTPHVIKIDTETFEPAVIAGARETLRRLRPWLVVEVLHRRGHDHGVELCGSMRGLGYSYYRITGESDWTARTRITGEPGSRETDWLLAPSPIDRNFAGDVRRWADSVARCTADRNPRLPVAGLAYRVLRSDGVPGLRRAVRAFVRDHHLLGRAHRD
jgi:FkbM family methyltransferase